MIYDFGSRCLWPIASNVPWNVKVKWIRHLRRYPNHHLDCWKLGSACCYSNILHSLICVFFVGEPLRRINALISYLDAMCSFCMFSHNRWASPSVTLCAWCLIMSLGGRAMHVSSGTNTHLKCDTCQHGGGSEIPASSTSFWFGRISAKLNFNH